VVAVSAYSIYLRQRSARFFLAAFALLMVGAVLASLRGVGVLPSNVLTSNGLQIGSAFEMILLAFALADRYNQLRKEKTILRAQKLRAEHQNLLAQAQVNQAQALAQAQQAHNETLQVQAELAQSQLVQSEKMASLGQLVASVTHEINTPIGAIKSSGASIADALQDVVMQLPPLLQRLDAATSHLLVELLQQANRPKPPISSREERAIIKTATAQLDAAGLDQARQKASLMVSFNVQAELEKYLPLLQHPDWEQIMEAARNLSIAMGSANNVNVAVERVAKIVLALKSFSHFNQSQEMIEAHLVEGIETVLTIYQGQTKVGITIERNYETIAPIACLADELNQVWTNLIHNALQAMNHEGTLTIGIRKEGNEAVVSVGDSGCGIPEEIRNKIFDVFFTTKPAGVGSGLGLDIVKKIIEKHSGRIDLQSEVGVGTTFSVYLPYLAAA
jgi:signal transduction histidine kinase